jgi:hypothetical protein
MRANRQKSELTSKLVELAELPMLTPVHVELVRRKMLALIATNLDAATEVLAGTRTWTPTQLGLFKTMLNKLVPDVSQSHQTIDVRQKPREELTREDLLLIASGASVLPKDGETPAISAASPQTVPELGVHPQMIAPNEARAPARRATRDTGGGTP